MAIKDALDQFRDDLQERFTSVWKLLYDTDRFLSRTPLFSQYEPRLRDWRHELQLRKNDSEQIARIRSEIVAMRRELRSRGYNLRLGAYELSIGGFRSDDALGQGFARAVLAVLPDGFYAISGQGNHIDLQAYLDQDLRRMKSEGVRSIHSLWYRWDNRLLRISGADSETREDFNRLISLAEKEALRIIAAFQHI
jgi:hypothetical protein